MLYNVLFNGSKIDELLEAISHIKSVINGWVKLESTPESVINFDDLINPGNFSFEYWENGPDDTNLITPIKVIVSKEQTLLRQYVFSMGFNQSAYYRMYDISTKTFGEWEKAHLPKGITVSDTEPIDPNGEDIWINTSNKDAIIQYYDEIVDNWVSLNPYDYMDNNTYNPDGNTFPDGIYQYIDDRLKNISGGQVDIDFTEHINDSTIHITADEKAIFDSKMTSDTLLTAIQNLIDELTQYIAQQSQASGVDIPAIQLLVDQISNTLSNHISDTVKHPTAEQRADWDSKSDKEHTHTKEQITISTDDVSGDLSIDQIPDDAKERQVTVQSEEELLALTVNEVQNGDFVYIKYSEDKNEVLIVVDQTKLGTKEAFLSLSIPDIELNWENVQNKPTTIDELGIEDKINNPEVDLMISELDTTVSDSETQINNNISKYDSLNHQTDSHTLETLIDIIDIKMSIIKKLIAT